LPVFCYFLKEDKSFSLIGVFLEHDVLSGAVDAGLLGRTDCAVVHFTVVEADGDLLVSSVGGAAEALERQRDIELIGALIDDFGVDEVQHIFGIADARPVVGPLDFVETAISPVLLLARADLPVAAGDGQVGRLDGHLVEIMLIELIDEGLFEAQQVDALPYGHVVFIVGREDSAHKVDFLMDSPLLYFILKIGDVCLLL
jgi:hypothetical protein